VEIIVTESASSLRLSSIAFYYSVALFWERVGEEGEKKRRITPTTTTLYKDNTTLWSDK
jgi:hypothetical protein